MDAEEFPAVAPVLPAVRGEAAPTSVALPVADLQEAVWRGPLCSNYSAWRQAPCYRRAATLARTTAQPWLRWQFLPSEWQSFAAQEAVAAAQGSRRLLWIIAGVGVVPLLLSYPWQWLSWPGVLIPAALRIFALAWLLLYIPLWLLLMRREASDTLRFSGPAEVIITPLLVRQGNYGIRLFDDHIFCRRIWLDTRRSPARLNFEICTPSRGSYSAFPTIVPIPAGGEAAAQSLLARFQAEIFDWPTPPADHSVAAAPRPSPQPRRPPIHRPARPTPARRGTARHRRGH